MFSILCQQTTFQATGRTYVCSAMYRHITGPYGSVFITVSLIFSLFIITGFVEFTAKRCFSKFLLIFIQSNRHVAFVEELETIIKHYHEEKHACRLQDDIPEGQ